jgi:hypothetical protein
MQNLISSIRGAQVFQKSRSYFKIMGTIRVTFCKFHTEDPQVLGTTIQNLVTRMTWHSVFVHPRAE